MSLGLVLSVSGGLQAQQNPAGNTASNAIPITLADPDGDGIWTPAGTSAPAGNNRRANGYTDNFNPASGARWGSAGRDLFFVINGLPVCLDSLLISTCTRGTTFNTRIHLISQNDQDTISNDDQGTAACSSAGFGNPSSTSQIVAIGRPNTNRVTSSIASGTSARVERDTLRLVQGYVYYIVVEGAGAADEGNFELIIQGYRLTPPRPTLSGPRRVCPGTDVNLNAPYPGGVAWKWYQRDPATGALNPLATTTTSAYTLNNLTSAIRVVVEVELDDPNNEPSRSPCARRITPTSDILEILVGADGQNIRSTISSALWGETITMEADPTDSHLGTLTLEVSSDGGNTWNPISDFNGSFPFSYTFPPMSVNTYTSTYRFRTKAECPSDIAYGNPLIINVSDRRGNRLANAVPVTLDSIGVGLWRVVITDSTTGAALSDEYNPASGSRLGTPARDLFFALTLPACLDSLILNTCSLKTNYNTYIHLINATAQDTISNDDQQNLCSFAPSASRLLAIGLPNENSHTTADVSAAVRDTLLLIASHTYYIVVEGAGSAEGKFQLTITGYKSRPARVTVSGLPSAGVCIGSPPITLTARASGATAYRWLDAEGNLIPDATSPTYTITPPNADTTITLTAQAIINPNNDPSCLKATDTVLSDRLLIGVEGPPEARIADAAGNIISRQTLRPRVGANIVLQVSSPYSTGNTYTWRYYPSIPPSGTPVVSTGNTLAISYIQPGRYTIVMEAIRRTGACGPGRDTVYVDVAAGLQQAQSTLSIQPNPNTGTFTLIAPAAGTHQVELLDMTGRLIARETFTGSTHQMRMSLPAGIYQMRLIQGQRIHLARLLITD